MKDDASSSTAYVIARSTLYLGGDARVGHLLPALVTQAMGSSALTTSVSAPASEIVGRRLKQLVCTPAMETDTATGSCSKLKRYDWIGFALRPGSRGSQKVY